MEDILLAKPILSEGWIDAAVGEPYLIRDNLFKYFDMTAARMAGVVDFEYQRPNGLPSLVNLLEEKHQAKVIISNGAKQGVGALLHAIKRTGRSKVGLKIPYWSLFKPLIEMHNLKQVESIDDSDAYLFVHPNNPDGYCYDEHYTNYYTNLCAQTNKPLIHDAAYYNHVYLPSSYNLKPIGDVQVFTLSKLLGLSGLRVGYSVFYNMELYKYCMKYMEHMTVGVSSLSQSFAFQVLTQMNKNLEASYKFENDSYLQLQKNKKLACDIKSSILDTSNIMNTPGMFLWAKCYNMEAFKEAKINVVEGTPFGAPGYVRMNLAFSQPVMEDIIARLNKAG